MSTFTAQPVSVDYAVEGPDQTLESGTIEFAPGEILRTIFPAALSDNIGLIRVGLRNPTNADVTGIGSVYFVSPTSATNTMLVSTGAAWRYLDTGEDAGSAWRW